jgi:UDP-N-acetylglucosamine acyltransferase
MIHSTAIIHPKAQIGAGCEIGPYCVIGEHVTLGDECKLHSHVVVDGHTRVGQGNEMFPFAAIGMKTQDLKYKGGNPRLEIGDHNVFREGVTVHCATNDGDATIIGSHIIMSGFAGLAGHCVVEDHASFGGYVAVHQFCRIGRLSMMGGCTKIVQDVPPFMIVDGNPGETRTINKIGLERNGVSDAAQSALKQAYKLLFREGLTITNALAKIECDLPALPEIKHLVQFVRSSERGISK